MFRRFSELILSVFGCFRTLSSVFVCFCETCVSVFQYFRLFSVFSGVLGCFLRFSGVSGCFCVLFVCCLVVSRVFGVVGSFLVLS